MQRDLERCLETLHNKGTILYPTDTIWGLGCDATNHGAVEKIIALKNRPHEKSFVVLVADEKMLANYTSSLDADLLVYLKTHSRPTTVIYPHAKGLAKNVVANDGSIAIRICKDVFCQSLLMQFAKPILSTSANISGMPTPKIFAEISPEVIAGADYTVNHRREDNKLSEPSSIIKWNNGKIIVIR